ncbi:AraC family transcriptional regulator [Gracilibacillus marinus]|uniref:AraC family transcriptional regulator n=1 Tax=Gracilibacillus marinus TaxID=630535 RepID=A0ABV8VXL4_9BACI
MQILEYLPNKLEYFDLYINQFGKELCMPKHYQHSKNSGTFLIHYIRSGEGVFHTSEQSYSLKAGQGFLTCPNMEYSYEADERDPWYYYWVGFDGIQAEKLLSKANLHVKNPIFLYDQDHQLVHCFEELCALKQQEPLISEVKGLGHLYSILSILIQEHKAKVFADVRQDHKVSYAQEVLQYIHEHFHQKITISEIADEIGLDRSYLCSLFRNVYNKSIQEYLIHYRIQKACELLEHTTLAISSIAQSVGYEDPLQFSKLFKKIKQLSPKNYRQKIEMVD